MTLRLCFPAVVCIATMTASCSRDPNKTSRKYLASGDEYAQAGKYKEAAIEYRNAAKATPELAEPHAKLADASLHTKDVQTAAVDHRDEHRARCENEFHRMNSASVHDARSCW